MNLVGDMTSDRAYLIIVWIHPASSASYADPFVPSLRTLDVHLWGPVETT